MGTFTKEQLESELRAHDGVIAHAARALQAPETTVRSAVRRYQIDLQGIRRESSARKLEEAEAARAAAPGEEPEPAQPQELVDAQLTIHRMRQEKQQRERIWKEMADRADLMSNIRRLVEPHMERLTLPKVKPPKLESSDKSNITLQHPYNDLHWGKQFSGTVLNGLNAFNPNIAARRIQHTVDVLHQYKDIYSNMGNVPEQIIIPLIGDMFNGELHPEDEDNYASIMTQAIDCALVVGQAIWELAHIFPKVIVVSPAGDNHTRLTKKSATSAKAFGTCVNTMFMQCISLLLAQLDHVKVVIDTSHQTYYTVYGRTWGLCHGNMIKGGGGQLGIPAYGMRRHHDGNIAETVILAKRQYRELKLDVTMTLADRMERMAALLEGIVDHTLVGHFHTRQTLEFTAGDLFIMPSAMGPDPYARDALRKPGSMARSVLFALHPKHDIMSEHVINLQQFMDEDCTSRYHWGVEDFGGDMAAMMEDWKAAR